jgi:hypothetical protein
MYGNNEKDEILLTFTLKCLFNIQGHPAISIAFMLETITSICRLDDIPCGT